MNETKCKKCGRKLINGSHGSTKRAVRCASITNGKGVYI